MMNALGAPAGFTQSPWWPIYRIGSMVGAATGAYHGYKRNDSVGWAVGWFLLGGLVPFATIPISIAQGFGKAKYKTVAVKNRKRRRRA